MKSPIAMPRPARLTAVLGAAALSLTPALACAAITGSPEGTGIPGRDWHLADDDRAYFIIEGTELHGSNSCNTITGKAQVMDGHPQTITFDPAGLASTLMFCTDEGTEQTEQATRDALQGTRVVEWQDADSFALIDEDSGESWVFVRGDKN